MHIRRLALAPLAMIGVLSLAACGSDDDNGADPASSTPASGAGGLVVTAEDGLRWDAASYTAAAGDVQVTLSNDSSLPHTLLVLDSAGASMHEEIKTTSKGDEASTTLALQPGTYTVICTISGHASMKSDLVVS